MTCSESLECYSLVPSDESLPAIRQLLAQEAEIERSGEGEREFDLALLCCVQLFSRGLLEDVLRIWDAKQSGFDLACYLDIDLLCGAGVKPTLQYLKAHPFPEAAEALDELSWREEDGYFTEWTPAAYLDRWRPYFQNNY